MVNRREVLASFLLGGMEAGAEPQQHPSPSLYIPKPHVVEDRKFLHDFMDDFPFVDLVTADPTPRITHIPCLLNRERGEYGTIFGHISKNNAQSKAIDSKQGAVVVFRGPHSYISPTWYSKVEGVPTWNFAVVHASGTLRPITDMKVFHDRLASLIGHFEGQSAYDFAKLPEKTAYGMMGGIVGFEMEIELLEGKFKLGQERSAADREGVLRGLRAAKHERSILDVTENFYKRTPVA
jgi:transcriptional regulator